MADSTANPPGGVSPPPGPNLDSFLSNTFGNPTGVYVSGSDNTVTAPVTGDICLASYTYESGVNNGRLQRMTYGNGAYVEYTYDLFDRVVR